MGSFEILEHTADTGIRAYGATAEDALTQAALGMFTIITDPACVAPVQEVTIEVVATDREALLHDWLEELLYQSLTRGMLFSRFAVNRLDETSLQAAAWGEALDPAKHPLKIEIKAVTYHRLAFGPSEGGWEAVAIFDI